MKGRKRIWNYRINDLEVEITGRFYNQGKYIDPVIRINKITGKGPFDFETVHHSTAKNVKTLKARLRKLVGFKNIDSIQRKR